MHVRGTFVALALSGLLAFPMLASASIVQRWQSLPTHYGVVSEINDLDANGQYEMVTEEVGGGGVHVGVRSTSTGALLAQTVGLYQPIQFWITYLEPTNQIAEIIFTDLLTGNVVCVNYTTGATTLAVRWSFLPPAGSFYSLSNFIDFDGNGQLSMVLKDEHTSTFKYYIYDNNGALVTTIDHTGLYPATSTVSIYANVFENPNRQSLMIQYHTPPDPPTPTQDFVYLFASSAPPPPTQAPAGAASEPRPVRSALPKVRSFLRSDNGSWTEAGVTEPTRTATPHVVTLP
jgi:hypothetical protein